MTKQPFTIFRRITKRFVVICNIVLITIFLAACLAYYVNPITYWYIGFLGLAFPYLLLLVLLFIVLWLCFKSKWVFLNLAALLIGSQNINAVFAFHPFAQKFELQQRDSTTLRVLQWNTMSFGEYEKDRIKGSDIREKMLEYIKKQDADVLCFQEFFDAYHPDFSQNIKAVNDLAYPYYYYSKDYDRYAPMKTGGEAKIGYWGTIIFSKYPLLDSGKIAMVKDDLDTKESLCYIDIEKNNKRVRIYSTHLQSVRFGKNEYESIQKAKQGNEGAISSSKSIFSKLKRAYVYRKRQADIIHNAITQPNYPIIITGDFNDVPNSYTYSTIKDDLQDVFLKKGFGIGRTFSAISPTLRIDYMFASKDFKVIQCKKDNIKLSDHYPILADLQLK